MPSPLADSAYLTAALQEALRNSDWAETHLLAASLAVAEVPSVPGEAAVCLDQIMHTLTLAKMARAELAARLNLVRAASAFGAFGCQDFAASTDF